MLDRRHVIRRLTAAILIGFASAALAVGLGALPGASTAMRLADWVFYDWFYRLRPMRPPADSPVLHLSIGRRSLAEIDQVLGYGWPWPRDGYALIAAYAQKHGAKAVVLDILLAERSASGAGDDEDFGFMIDELTIPIVFARFVEDDGAWGPFKPNIRRPVDFGGTDVTDEKIFRTFYPIRHGKPTLALAAIKAAGLEPRLPVDRPFLLHYYGPDRDADAKATFPPLMASRVLLAESTGDSEKLDVDPALFKDKIVVVGLAADSLMDLKVAPHDSAYPGAEVQITAMVNMIRGDAVRPAGVLLTFLAAAAAGLAASLGTVLPRSTWLKVLICGCVCAGAILFGYVLFMGGTIWWLPMAPLLLAAILGTVGGMAFSYFSEDRLARQLLKALEQCLSKEVAAELARDPRKLAVGGRQMEMTVMFTDLAGFTELTEKLREKIEKPLNFYLDAMSAQILEEHGTLDKYIGDAILTFWNAPIDQPEHARHACAAALAIQRREREIAGQMAEMGVTNTITRMGISTGSMVVGFMGSERKMNYTVIGDTVNLAARLEPANKLYGTQIMVAEPTVRRVKDLFLFRQVDRLRVKGKKEPMAVFELMGDASARNTELGELAGGFEAALGHYFRQEWDRADAILLELAGRFPEDGPTLALRDRVADFKASPPPTDWDGVYVAKTK